MNTPELTEDEVQWIDQNLKSTWAGCTPIFVKNQKRPPAENARVEGTLTLVMQENRAFAVTAHHVIRENTDKHVYSPIKPGWEMKSLRQYDWRVLTTIQDNWLPNVDIDLAIAELSPSEISEIDPARFCELYPCKSLTRPFRAVVRGYLKKNHRRRDIDRNTVATTTSYGLVSNGIKATIRPPRADPDPLIHISFPFDRKTVRVWDQSMIKNIDGIAPQPNGLSGGPIVFLGNRNPSYPNVPMFAVIGFLIRQSDRNRTLTGVASEVVFNSVSPFPKK